jgi:hypothetical protein
MGYVIFIYLSYKVMKTTLLLLFLLLAGTISYSQVHVKGYYKSNGTYVQPHERTPPNNTITDNYSYPGNYNPNTRTVTGSTTYTRSKIDDYSTSSSVDWKAIGSNEPKDFTTSSSTATKYKSPSATSTKTVAPKYVPLEKRNYLVNPKGDRYGYSYGVETNNIYKTFFVYNLKNLLQFRINHYPNGDMYVYAPDGSFVKYLKNDK